MRSEEWRLLLEDAHIVFKFSMKTTRAVRAHRALGVVALANRVIISFRCMRAAHRALGVVALVDRVIELTAFAELTPC